MKPTIKFQYWTGGNGSIIVCSDGRYASTVRGDADPEHDGLSDSEISDYARSLIAEAFEEKAWGNWDEKTDDVFTIGEMGLLMVTDEYTDFFGQTEEAIKAFVGDESVVIPDCFYWENRYAPWRLYDTVNGVFVSETEVTIDQTRRDIVDGKFSDFELENFTLEGCADGDSIALADLV